MLIGNPAKAARVLGWKSKTPFQELVRIMVVADHERVKKKGY
jgi:GDPmannose 4,6-dehydratase